MAPKKKEPVEDAEDDWRKVIENFQINDNRFRVQVVLMECAGSESDRLYVRKFENFAMKAKRFVIKNICQIETFFMINQLGVENKKHSDPNNRVFVEGQAYLKEKQDIPSEILALIIKHLIIKMKQEYLSIKRQKIEVKEGMRLESTTMLTTADVRELDISTLLPEPEPTSTPKKKKGEPETTPPPAPVPGKKYNTWLRVAGEEWRDSVYVDDCPLDGPNLYVVISGFGDPFLPISLIRIGVPLKASVQIRIDSLSSKDDRPRSSAVHKRGQSQAEYLFETSYKFWDDLQKLRINKEYSDYFKNTAFIIYYPSLIESDVAIGNAETFYDELSYLMYDIQDLSRQHDHYLRNMDVMHVPEDKVDECYFKNYCQNVEWIPLDSITVFNILDSILETVTLLCQVSEETESETDSRLSHVAAQQETKFDEHKKMELAETLINNLFTAFQCTEDNKKSYRLTYGEEYENYKTPTVIRHGNFAECSLFHVQNAICDNIIYSALTRSPINLLWEKIYDISDEIYNKNFLHLNLLVTCFERKGVDICELYRLIYILACRKLYNNKSSLKKQFFPPNEILEFKRVYLKRSILATPLKTFLSETQKANILSRSFSKISSLQFSVNDYDDETDTLNFVYDCPDIIELVSATEIVNETPNEHMIDDFEYFEDFSGTAALQIILEAYNNYNCVDYKYSEITDSIILMFYNSHDTRGISNEEWRNHLTTPVCLQDFFDFILDENYEWIFNEDKVKDQAMALAKPLGEQHVVNVEAGNNCLDNTDVSAELLIEGSLKYEMLVAADDELVEKSLTVDTKSLKSTTPSTPKSKMPVTPSQNDFEEKVMKKEPKIFFGYNLGDRRVEALGKDSRFFSEDGTRVSCSYMLFVPMDLEYLILNINPGNRDNNFWVHKCIGDIVTPKLKTKCKSFRITCRDQTLINIVVNSYEIKIPCDTSESQIKLFHSLYVTWPNGLITQTIHKKQSTEISHIKQFFLVAKEHLREKMRCVSLKGEVIIFRESDEVEVLKPDGTYIRITQYDKQAVEIVEDDTIMRTSKRNSLERKVEIPTKSAKSSIAHAKSAKPVDYRDSIILDTAIEYEIRFDAFEIVEANGIRTAYLNGLEFEVEKYLIRHETDYSLAEKYFRRMDGTSIFFDKNGTQVVRFPNGTRIITDYVIEANEIYVEWTAQEIEMFKIIIVEKTKLAEGSEEVNFSSSNIKNEEGFILVSLKYTVEHDDFTAITINESTKEICITSQNNSTVTIDENLNYKIKLDNETNANFDGDCLHISYEACDKCKAYTVCDVTITDDTDVERNWLELKDSYDKCINLDYDGNIYLNDSEDTQQQMNSLRSQHLECSEICKAKSLRFFVLKRDLTCSELLHRKLVDMLRKSCASDPWCSIANHTALKGYRSLISILEPVNFDETEKSTMNSAAVYKIENIKEKKGHYHWMRPYGRFVPEPRNFCSNSPPLPKAFILRLLELQWYPKIRPKFKGAKELLRAILEYRQLILSNTNISKLQVPCVIRPPKLSFLSPSDRHYVEDVTFRICNDLKIFHKRDMISRCKLTITTKPPPEIELLPLDDDEIADTELQSQIRLQLLNEKEQKGKEKRRLRYWRKREEQWKEEQFYLYLLRAPQLAPYFKNPLGGALWWDINFIAGKAAEGSRRTNQKTRSPSIKFR